MCRPDQSAGDQPVAPTPVPIVVLSRCPDADDAEVQSLCAEIDGTRVTFDGVPEHERTAAALEGWLRRVYTDAELRALAETQADVTALGPPRIYFALRPEDLHSPVLQAMLRVLLSRLRVVEAAANVSPTTLDGFLEACLSQLQP